MFPHHDPVAQPGMVAGGAAGRPEESAPKPKGPADASAKAKAKAKEKA